MHTPSNFERITKDPETLAKEIYRICVLYRTKDFIDTIADACQATDTVSYNEASLHKILTWLKEK